MNDYAILQHYVGGGPDRKKRLSRRRVVSVGRGGIMIQGSANTFTRSGAPRGGGEGSRLLEPTAKTLKELTEFEAEDERKLAEREAAEARYQAERTRNADAAAQWMRTVSHEWLPEKLVERFGVQLLNDIHEVLVREGELKPTESR